MKISFPQRIDAGLGIELFEIAGGREDGLGVTVVQGLVQGGSADNSGILPGNSIIAVTVKKRSSDDVGVSIATECLGYYATVDAIRSLPPATGEEEEEIFILTVKRLCRKPKISLKLQFPPSMGVADQTLEFFSGENLRRAMLTRGVKLNDKYSARLTMEGLEIARQREPVLLAW